MSVQQQVEVLKNYIGGEWVEPNGENVKEDVNPADQRDVLAYIKSSDEQDANQAIDAAQQAFLDWKHTPSSARGGYLSKLAERMRTRQEELTEAIVKEMGKTYTEAKKEVLYAAGIADFYAGEGRRMSGKTIPADIPNVKIETVPEPIGVSLIVTPWNFPLSIPTWKIAPAVISGNSVVLKTSSETPLVGKLFMELVEEAEFPAGVINHIIGPGKLVSHMIDHPDVKAISFTGSNPVGQKIYQHASQYMKRVHLEMGGKNPLLVLGDADVDQAVEIAVGGALGQAGQACTATGRVIVDQQIHDDFVEKLSERVKQIQLGSGMKEGVHMGPQVNKNEQESTLSFIKEAVEEGAHLQLGGSIPKNEEVEHGFFVEPTILTNVTEDMKIAKEEVFGPVLIIMKSSGVDESIKIANNVDYGLSASVCTNRTDHMNRVLDELESGLVKANMPTTGTFFQAPFGGYKQSSSGSFKELGREGVEFFTRYKTRYIKTE